MLTKLHNHLLTKSNLYSKYHSNRFHSHIHWGIFGFTSAILSLKVLAVLLAISFVSLLPVTQSFAAPINKTWDSQSDWSPWSKDQTSSDVTAGAVTLAPDTSGGGTIIPAGQSGVVSVSWYSYSTGMSPTNSWSLTLPTQCGYNCFTTNGTAASGSSSAAWTGLKSTWTAVADIHSGTTYTDTGTPGYSTNSFDVTVDVPSDMTPGTQYLSVSSIGHVETDTFTYNDIYVGSFTVPSYYPKGTALTTYDGQSDGSTSSSYIWSDLTKSDAADVDETITYYALADNSSSDPTVPTHDNAGTESNWTDDGWTQLSFSSNVADLTSLTNTRYLHIASYLATTDTTKTPSINSLSLNYTLASITVTSPNGGETWYYSSAKDFTKLITWTLEGATSSDHIHLQYSTDNGATWTDITGATNLTYNTTSYTWTLPKVDTTQAQIKAILENSSNTAIATDINDANFNLKPMKITITSPENPDCYLVGPGDTITGCATTTPGLTKTITWTTQGASQADHIKIEYSTNNGSTWTTLAASLSNTALSYDWTLPTNIKSTQALVRGTLEDSSNLDLADDSTGTFTIHSNIKPTISPTDPSDGATVN